MQRAVLVALLVALGCTAVLAQDAPCAPPQFSTTISVTVSGAYGAFENGVMAVDFVNDAYTVNVTSGVTASNDPFVGQYLQVNNTGYWIQQGQCFPTNLSSFSPTKCLPPNGNFSTSYVGGVNVTSYTIIGAYNTSAYTYTTAESIPVMYQEFDWSETNAPANSTGIVYSNPSYNVDPSVFVVPAICQSALQKDKPLHANTHHGRLIKKIFRF